MAVDRSKLILEESNVDAEVLRQFATDNEGHATGDKRPNDLVYESWCEASDKQYLARQKWILCLNMVAGEQWVLWTPRTGIVQSLSDSLDSKRPDVIRAVVNRIRPAVERKVAQMTATLHIPEVLPAPGRADAIDRAKQETGYLQALWLNRKCDEDDEDIKSYLAMFGPAWLKVEWDNKLDLPDFSTASPFEVLVTPYGVKRPHQGQQVIQTKAVPIDELRAEYPNGMRSYKMEELDEDRATILGATDSFLTHQSSSRQIRGMTVVRYAWQKPNAKFPKGWKMVCTRERLLYLQPLNLPDDPRLDDFWCPFFQARFSLFPDAMYPDGMVYPLAQLQVLINKSMSDKLGNSHAQGRPRLLIPKSTQLTVEDFDDLNTPVEVNDENIDRVTMPQWLAPGTMSSDAYNLQQELEAAFDDNANTHNVTRGAAQPNITSGVQAQLFQAQDSQPLEGVLNRVNRMWSRAFERALTLTAMNQKNPASLMGVDPRTSSPLSVKEFLADKTRLTYSVNVTCLSRTTLDRLAHKENFLQMAQYGLLNDMTPSQARRAFESGGDVSLFASDMQDRVVQQRENVQLAKGDPNVMVRDHDNHPVHIEEIVSEMRKAGFLDYPVEIQEAYIHHKKAHETEALKALQGQNMPVEGAGPLPDSAMQGGAAPMARTG